MTNKKLKKISDNDVVYFISLMVATNLDNDTIIDKVVEFLESFKTKDWSYNIQQLDIKKLNGFKPAYSKKRSIPELE